MAIPAINLFRPDAVEVCPPSLRKEPPNEIIPSSEFLLPRIEGPHTKIQARFVYFDCELLRSRAVGIIFSREAGGQKNHEPSSGRGAKDRKTEADISHT